MATRNSSLRPRRRRERRPRKRPEAPARTAELRIVRIGSRGDGIAETAEGDVYVPLTVPGDHVRAEVRGDRAERFDLLACGPDRVTPPCPHFGACGGCTLQHVAAEAYRDWKRQRISSALAARGLEAAAVRDIIALPPATRRRAVFQAARGPGGMALGFAGHRSHRICAIDSCAVLVPSLQAALPALRELAQVAGPGRYHVTASDTGLDVNLLFEPEAMEPLAFPGWARAHDAARISVLCEVQAQRRLPVTRLSDVDVALPPGAFLQPSAEGQAVLVDLVGAAVGGAGPVVDLFAGLGTFSFALARDRAVHAVEGDAASLCALEAATRHAPPGFKPVTAEIRDLDRAPLTVKELNRFAAVVFDPPRAGAAAQARSLAASAVPRIVAVSCNPATFARDAAALVDGGYQLHHVTPVDQFVWSAHVELVGLFERN